MPTAGPVIDTVPVVSRKAPVIFGVLTLGMVLILVLRSPRTGDTTFRLAANTDFVALPELTVPSMAGAWTLTAVCALLTAESVRRYVAHRSTPVWAAGGLRRRLDGGLPDLGRGR